MIDRDSPVTEHELHAYVDGEIPADRRNAVEAWLGSHPEHAARVAHWRAQADAIRARYDAIASEPAPARFDLDKIAHASRPWRAVAAAAVIAAFLVGGVVGWMAHGASAAAPSRFDVFTSEALDAHKVYVVEVRHPVEVTASEEAHLVQWLSKKLGHPLKAPDLSAHGFRLVGGRLLSDNGRPAALFMYENRDGLRITIHCVAEPGEGATAFRYREIDGYAAFYWIDEKLAYAVIGKLQREKLLEVARTTYAALEKK